MLCAAHLTADKMLHIQVKFLAHHPSVTTVQQQGEGNVNIPVKE